MGIKFARIVATAATVALLLGAGVDRGLADDSGAAHTTPPVISIFNVHDGDSFSGGQKKIIYDLTAPAGVVVDRIEVLVDGQPVAVARGVERSDEGPSGPGSTAGQVMVPLPNRDATVSLIAHAGSLVSAPATVKLAWAGPGADRLKPRLYAVVIGVSGYTHAELALHYAAKDATDFAAALKAQTGGLYSEVQAKVLTDAGATRSSILSALEWLKRATTSNDLGVVYFAGHGWTDEVGNFWLLPVDATPSDLGAMVARDDILRPMEALAGKALLFIDACHAASTPGRRGQPQASARGLADMDTLIRDFGAAGHGIVTFASSTGREVSLERDDWGNGAFTKALVEALTDPKAAANSTGQITLIALNHYVADRVKELTGGIQHPIMNQNNVPDFPVGIVRLPPLASAPAMRDEAAGGGGERPSPVNSGVSEAQLAYEAAARIGTRTAYQAIVETFPETVQAKLAAAAIAAIGAQQVVRVQPEGTHGPDLRTAISEPPASQDDAAIARATAGLGDNTSKKIVDEAMPSLPTEVISECDRLAAVPLDPDKPVTLPGVASEVPDDRAVAACRQAIAEYPKLRRFKHNLAGAFHRAHQYKQAVEIMQPEADAGDTTAMAYLGNAYLEGMGVVKELTEARRWLERSSRAGNPIGSLLLVSSYLNGDLRDLGNVKLYLPNALDQLEKARSAGDPDASAFLGSIYLNPGAVLVGKFDPAQAGYLLQEAILRKSALGIDFFFSGAAKLPVDVRVSVERFLADLGYEVGNVDGVIDDKTKLALSAYVKGAKGDGLNPVENAVRPKSGLR